MMITDCRWAFDWWAEKDWDLKEVAQGNIGL
jgi:hypothetical protein